MILVDQVSKSYLKLSFKYCQTYVSLMKSIRKHVPGMEYDSDRRLWYFPKDEIDILEDMAGERLVWLTPKWKLYGLTKPDYTRLYSIPSYALPKLNNITLFKYQEFGCNWMIDRLLKYNFAVNCMSVGLGKSICSVVVQEWMKINKGVKKTILVCPKLLKGQWEAEVFQPFTPAEKTFLIKNGVVKKKRLEIYKEFEHADSGTLIINFHLFLFDKDILKNIKIDYAVIDEAQDIATRGGKINTAVKAVVKKIPYLTILTATPIKSKPDNLYAVFGLKDDAILGNWNDFANRYIDYEHTKFGVQKVGYKNLTELKDVVDDYVLRLTEHEIDLELPDIITKIYRIDPDKAQQSLLGAINNNKAEASQAYASAKFNNKISAQDKEKLYGRVMLHSMAARAVADDPRLLPMSRSSFLRRLYADGLPAKYPMSPKTELCIELVREIIDNNNKVIIFTEFERQVRLLAKDLKKAFKTEPVLTVTGMTDTEEDVITIQRFKKEPDCKILIGTSALQTGQNLQAAGFVIHFDLPQAQDGIQQRRGRARRVGSKFKKIKEYFLITKDSPEITKFERLKIQSHMSNSIFSTDEEQSKTLRRKSN